MSERPNFRAENDRLRAEVERLMNFKLNAIKALDEQETYWKAEVERLTKELRTLRPYKPWPDPLRAENEALREAGEGLADALCLPAFNHPNKRKRIADTALARWLEVAGEK